MRDLAHDPHTARHIATKFATYFIADDPSPQSVARLESVFNQTGGDLKALAIAAVEDRCRLGRLGPPRCARRWNM